MNINVYRVIRYEAEKNPIGLCPDPKGKTIRKFKGKNAFALALAYMETLQANAEANIRYSIKADLNPIDQVMN